MAILVFAFTGKRFGSGTWTRLHQVATGATMSGPYKGMFRKKRKQLVPCNNPGKHTINMVSGQYRENVFVECLSTKQAIRNRQTEGWKLAKTTVSPVWNITAKRHTEQIILPGNNQCILAADLSVPCRPVQGSGWTQ